MCALLEVETEEVPTMSSVRSRGRLSVRAFDEGQRSPCAATCAQAGSGREAPYGPHPAP